MPKIKNGSVMALPIDTTNAITTGIARGVKTHAAGPLPQNDSAAAANMISRRRKNATTQ
jgi:hypothetical protein